MPIRDVSSRDEEARTEFGSFRWQSHWRGLYQIPVAA